jgi:hypothetical protein
MKPSHQTATWQSIHDEANEIPTTLHQGGRKYSSYSFLTSALDGDEWSASRPGCALPLRKTPGTHWIAGWVGLRAGVDRQARGNVLCPCRGSNPGRPVCRLTLYLLTETPKRKNSVFSVNCSNEKHVIPRF